MLRPTCTIEERKLVLKITLKALSENQLAISQPAAKGRAVRCPLGSEGGHICYVAASPLADTGGHAGDWAREFLCDYIPHGVVRTRKGENTDQALTRILGFESVESLRSLLRVGKLRPVVAAIEALVRCEEAVITQYLVELILEQAAEHPLGV